jgi:hypothetical protein
MTIDEFRASLTAVAAPEVSPLLRALWHDARGDWEAAHQMTQAQEDRDAAWVHAYLHRKEGDLGNARYWYRRAGRSEATGPLDDEWTSIVEQLLMLQ